MTSTKRLSPLTTKIVGLGALVAASFGGSGIAAARSPKAERGVVVARGQAGKVVAVGPVALHAYSQFAGGSSATPRRRRGQGSTGATPVQADRVATFAVGEGQVACLNTTTTGSYELLWHAVSQPARAAVVVAKAGH